MPGMQGMDQNGDGHVDYEDTHDMPMRLKCSRDMHLSRISSAVLLQSAGVCRLALQHVPGLRAVDEDPHGILLTSHDRKQCSGRKSEG